VDYLRARHVGVLFAIAGIASATLARTASQSPAAHVLRPYVRASDAELRRLDRGDPIARTLQSADSREITTIGAIRVRCSSDTFVARVREIERFKASEYLLQIGRFDRAPAEADVARLTLDAEDRRALAECRPGSCELRLPADAMARLRASIGWGAPNESDTADAAVRAFVAREAAAYVSGGLPALADYADQDAVTSRAAAFHALLRPSGFGSEYQRDMFEYLDRYPSAPPADIESVLYWSRERFGLKPIIAITHSALLRRGDVVVFASKQVYTSHYFDASLGMSVFVPAPGTGYGYVTYMNRSRVEGLHGPLAGMIRSIASRKGRDGLERTLLDVRNRLETNDSGLSGINDSRPWPHRRTE
jgi:hypothetical protein